VASLRRAFFVLVAGVLLATVTCVLVVTASEPRLGGTPSTPAPDEVVGVIHVHTVASDGGGTVEQVLAAAREQGLDFVVLTDHNVRGAPAWAYRDSVLLLVGEEVNTPFGHLLVVGEQPVGDRRGDREASPSPTDSVPVRTPAVDPDEGLRIVAHPTGRPTWIGWEGDEFDGIEIWNADTERRNDSLGEWLVAVSLLPLRRLAGLYHLLDYPGEELRRWDELMRERTVFGVCSVDAHHTLPLNRSRSLDLHFPAYRHSFQLARQHVLLDAPATGDAREDGRAILAAIGRGSSYCAFDGLADGRGARFVVTSGDERADIGESIEWRPGATLGVTLPGGSPDDPMVRVVRNGDVAWEERGTTVSVSLLGPGFYRVEVLVDRGDLVPWILTNPIHVTAPRGPPAPTP
jgi:hypothetical protein